MSADLVAASLALVAALVWATRGDPRALRDYVDARADTRAADNPRPAVSAQGRPVSPFAGAPGPRALECVDGVLDPDPTPQPRLALPQLAEIVVHAREADPLEAPAREALPRRRPASPPARRAIEPPRDTDRDGETGAVSVHGLLVLAAGLAVAAVLAARLLGAA